MNIVRKLLCALLSLVTVFSMAMTVFAVEIPAIEMPSREKAFAETPPPIVNSGVTRAISLDFGGLDGDNYFYCCECQVTQGKTKIIIDSCSWLPTYDIEIGLHSNTTLKKYSATLSGGSVNNVTITTDDVPSGFYWMYIHNMSDSTISSGVLFYSITG